MASSAWSSSSSVSVGRVTGSDAEELVGRVHVDAVEQRVGIGCTRRRRSRDRSACRAGHAPSRPRRRRHRVRCTTSHASATCDTRAASDTASPCRSSGTPLPSHRAYACSMPAFTSSSRPSRSANTPAAEQWLAICSTTALPPPAINRAPCTARCAGDAVGPGATEHEHHRLEAGEVGLGRLGAEVDVVAEERRGLVAVDRAPDVGEDADVVEHGEVGVVQPEPLAEAQPQPGRPDHVLGRLAEPEVGRQRERHQQLVEPNSRIRHGRTIPPPA